MIRLDRFGWQFGETGVPVLEDITLHVRRGEFVAIAGPSGCGKSTLAMAMCGLLVGRQAGQASGTLHVAENDVATTPLPVISQTVGLVQQNPEAHFATLAVSDEIAFGMENRCVEREEIRRRVDEALALLSTSHLRDRDLATLSGGEKQRVAVASIVAGRPDVLILDEPTASLDSQASRELFRALADLCRRTDLTVVIIEHKLSQLLPLKPRLVCLEKGRVTLDVPDGNNVETLPVWLGGEVSWQRRRKRGTVFTEHGSVRCTQVFQEREFQERESLVDVSGLTIEVNGNAILSDVSLQVRAGEVVAIMGPNGGGKTTLLQSLVGFVSPSAGTVRVCGEEAMPSNVSHLARQIGFVFQNADHQLVGETVLDDALFAAKNFGKADAACEEEGRSCLEAAGLDDRLSDHPYALSWGMKRRLNLISAVLHGPRLLLLDEPHAGQDWPNVAFMLDVVAKALSLDDPSGAGACVVVTHDVRVVVQSCTRVVFVAGGRIVVDAPVEEAFERLLGTEYDVYVITPPGGGR